MDFYNWMFIQYSERITRLQAIFRSFSCPTYGAMLNFQSKYYSGHYVKPHRMATIAMIQSWKRTERYLLDARAKLSPVVAIEHAESLGQFEEFIEHNELGLAYDWLESIARESDWVSTSVLESLAFAAASMERFDQLRAIDERLTLLHGYKYETLLSPEV